MADSAWQKALRVWNASQPMWCIPRRGTKEHAEVMALMPKKPLVGKKRVINRGPPEGKRRVLNRPPAEESEAEEEAMAMEGKRRVLNRPKTRVLNRPPPEGKKRVIKRGAVVEAVSAGPKKRVLKRSPVVDAPVAEAVVDAVPSRRRKIKRGE